MATKRQRASGSWEYKFQNKSLLPKPVYMTFLSQNQGDRFARYIDGMLQAGIVPNELKQNTKSGITLLRNLIYEYIGSPGASDNDKREVAGLLKNIPGDTPSHVDYEWAERWVAGLKERYKSNSINKKVTLLRRVFNWAIKVDEVNMSINPLTLLPRDYAKKKGESMERERRLLPGEEERIRAVLNPWEELFFDTALETAMRMSEILRIRWEDINLQKRTIFLRHTKNGHKREVPISTVLLKKLLSVQAGEAPYQDARNDFLFPFNKGGTVPKMKLVVSVSTHWKRLFAKAGITDLHFHDLRHEAISRLYERTTMTDLEISKISGHRCIGMLARYANLRASNLAEKMW